LLGSFPWFWGKYPVKNIHSLQSSLSISPFLNLFPPTVTTVPPQVLTSRPLSDGRYSFLFRYQLNLYSPVFWRLSPPSPLLHTALRQVPKQNRDTHIKTVTLKRIKDVSSIPPFFPFSQSCLLSDFCMTTIEFLQRKTLRPVSPLRPSPLFSLFPPRGFLAAARSRTPSGIPYRSIV